MVDQDEVFLHIHPSDNMSLHWARKLGGSLPAQALAARELPGSRKVSILHTAISANCTEEPAAFFVRPYHASNMCHLYNEALLPMAFLMRRVPMPRELYYYGDHMLNDRPLRHWGFVSHHLAARVLPADKFFNRSARATCRHNLLI